MMIDTGAAPTLLKVYATFGSVTVVDSTMAAAGTGVESEGVVTAGFPATVVTGVVDAATGLFAFVVSGPVAVGFGFAGGNRNCDIAITTSDRNRARKNRLSIREPGRSRQAGKGDTAECARSPGAFP
jgi:hypothetical protein